LFHLIAGSNRSSAKEISLSRWKVTAQITAKMVYYRDRRRGQFVFCSLLSAALLGGFATPNFCLSNIRVHHENFADCLHPASPASGTGKDAWNNIPIHRNASQTVARSISAE